MSMIFGVPLAVLSGQLLIGIINGAFYALLSLGLAVIFGLLKIINFAHGAMYMLGAMTTVLMFDYLGVNYWVALLLAPLLVGAFGVAIEYFLLRRIAGQDHIYSLLLTFGVALIISGELVRGFRASLSHAGHVQGWRKPRLHVHAVLPGLGHRSGTGRLLCNLVRD